MTNTCLRAKASLNLKKSNSVRDKINIISYFIFLLSYISSDYLVSCRNGFLKTAALTCRNE